MLVGLYGFGCLLSAQLIDNALFLVVAVVTCQANPLQPIFRLALADVCFCRFRIHSKSKLNRHAEYFRVDRVVGWCVCVVEGDYINAMREYTTASGFTSSQCQQLTQKGLIDPRVCLHLLTLRSELFFFWQCMVIT